MKRLAVFCDGTWNSIESDISTNVVCAATRIALRDGNLPQVAHYQEGVGAGRGAFPFFDRIAGGAFGIGLNQLLRDAYLFLVLNYEPGDAVYAFGFSRGAYTARSLIGLIRNCGILRRNFIDKVDDAIAVYRNENPPHHPDCMEFRDQFAHKLAVGPEDEVEGRAQTMMRGPDGEPQKIDIAYLGLWDTVGALGVPSFFPWSRSINDRFRFHDARLTRLVRQARHAVALDERRRAFEPALFENIDDLNARALRAQQKDPDQIPPQDRPYQQVWFIGDHGAIGGGASVTRPIAQIGLDWVLEGAARAGLQLDGFHPHDWRANGAYKGPFNFRTPAKSPRFLDLLIATLGIRPRQGPSQRDDAHPSLLARLANDSNYRRRWKKLAQLLERNAA